MPNLLPLHERNAMRPVIGKRDELYTRRDSIKARLAEIRRSVIRASATDPTLVAAEALLNGDDTVDAYTLRSEADTLTRDLAVVERAIEIHDSELREVEAAERAAAMEEHLYPAHEAIRGRIASLLGKLLKEAQSEEQLFDAAFDAGYRTNNDADGRVLFGRDVADIERWLADAQA